MSVKRQSCWKKWLELEVEVFCWAVGSSVRTLPLTHYHALVVNIISTDLWSALTASALKWKSYLYSGSIAMNQPHINLTQAGGVDHRTLYELFPFIKTDWINSLLRWTYRSHFNINMHLKWSAIFVWNKTPSKNRTIHILPTELPSKKSILKRVCLPWRANKSRVYIILRSNNPSFFLYFPSTEVDDSSGERQIQHIPKGTHGKQWIKLDRAVGVRTRPRGSAGLPLSLTQLRAYTATSHLHISVSFFVSEYNAAHLRSSNSCQSASSHPYFWWRIPMCATSWGA